MTTVRQYFWRIVALLIFAAGLWATVIRFTRGLGAATNLSDANPWGLWIGFDILCGVGLAAGGFTITAAVYILHLERFRPIARPAVLTAFLGYLLVVFALMYDLGRPYNIWRAIVFWNPRSVMFEVAWCVMLYTTVLALEFSPMLWERLGWMRLAAALRRVSIPLVGLGVILSTLHQSSLGSLYLIVPTKLYPLWYSPLLPLFFFLSSIAAGMAMVIFESGLSARAFGKALEFDILQRLARGMSVMLALYLLLRAQDLLWRGAWTSLFAPRPETWLFWLEIALFAVPMAFCFSPRTRSNPQAVFGCSILTVAGFLANRLNVSVTGLEASSGVRYFPSWMEISVTLAIVALGLVLFRLAVRHLAVWSPPAPCAH
jgi:Ni/Fe-hydrogenase subunit HybB-like protein